MLGKKISQNFAINITSMAFGVISSIFIARIGGPAILGNISLAMSFQVLIKSLLTHTVNSAHLKVYSEDQEVGLKNFLFVNIFYNIITTLIVILFVVWNNNMQQGTFTELQITLIVIFVLQDYLVTPLYIYVTDQSAKLNILRANLVNFSLETLVNIAKIAGVLVAQSEIGIAWYMMGACGLSAIYPLVQLLKSRFGQFSRTIFEKYIRYSLSIATSTIAYGLLISLDKVLLGLFSVSPERIGYYNVGNRLGLLLMTLGVNIGGIFLSVFSKNAADNNQSKTLEQLSGFERFITIFYLPVLLVPVLFGREIIALVYGTAYIPAYPVLVISLLFAYIKTLTIPYQNFLFANNRFKDFNHTSILFAISIFISAILFAVINPFDDLTISIAASLLLACLIERFIFIRKAAKLEKSIRFFFHPAIIIFFTCIAASWFLIDYFIPLNLLFSYVVRILILLSIIPLGFLFGVYVADDFYAILKMANLGPHARREQQNPT